VFREVGVDGESLRLRLLAWCVLGKKVGARELDWLVLNGVDSWAAFMSSVRKRRPSSSFLMVQAYLLGVIVLHCYIWLCIFLFSLKIPLNVTGLKSSMFLRDSDFRSALAVFLCNFNVRKTIRLFLMIFIWLACAIYLFGFFWNFLLGCRSLVLNLHN